MTNLDDSIEKTTNIDENTISHDQTTKEESTIITSHSESPSLIRVAKFFSAIFSPLLIPTYGIIIAFFLSYISHVSRGGVRLIVTGVIFLFTCVTPAIYIWILHSTGKLSDIGVNKQKERLKPYIFIIVLYSITIVYLSRINAPNWIVGFMIGGGISAITSALINMKWKISAHGAAIGGLVALVFSMWINRYVLFDFKPIVSFFILIAGIVGSSRILLQCHTLGQVLAGIANGFFWVFFMTI